MNRFTTSLALALFLTVLSSPFPASGKEAKARAGLGFLRNSIGDKAIAVLEKRGYIVIAGRTRTGQDLVYVQWDALSGLARRKADLGAFLRLYESSPDFDSLEGEKAALARLQKLPVGGLLTPGFHAAVDVLASHLAERDPLPPAAISRSQHTFFHTKPGTKFRKETHAELITRFGPLAKDFFHRHLIEPDAEEHFKNYLKEVHQIDAENLLRKGLLADTLSPVLRRWISMYLLEQKRLWNISETASRIKSIQRGTRIKTDLAELRTVLNAMGDPKGFLKGLRRAVKTSAQDARIRFRGTDLHVHSSEGGSTQHAGDEVVISLAYWVEGLGARESADVSIVGFINDIERGILNKTAKTLRQKNGGPYIFTAKVKLGSGEPVDYHIFLTAPGAETFESDVTIDVSPGYDDTVGLLGRSDSLVSRCRLNEADRALEGARSEAANLSASPQFKALLAGLVRRGKDLKRNKETRGNLKGSLDGAKLYASPEQCQYRTDRAKNALSYLKKLPPGCDQVQSSSGKTLAITLLSQLRRTESRKNLQRAFTEGAAKARRLEGDCRIKEAAELYAASLALLDSDRGSRCGAWGKDYTNILLNELARTAASAQIADAIDAEIAIARKAFAKGRFTESAARLYPLLSGIDALDNSSCFARQREKAKNAAIAASVALGPGSTASLNLPRDPLGKPLKSVRAASRRLREERRSQSSAASDMESPETSSEEEEE